ncbi:hypothetical protein [Enemella sp. A6]|uniref:hypothetical protein n=1 Tax=Enemella sp. A6 TaxID=3440152 RepID=UPI003EB8CCB2
MTLTTTDVLRVRPASRSIVIIGILVAAGCAAFAAINIWFELTNRFDSGPHAADAAALSVVNWYVVAIKLVGVIVATLAITPTTKLVSPRVIGILLWAGFATLAVYVSGSMIQAVIIVAGIHPGTDHLDAAAIGYVLGFLLASTGFGVLAVSFARRARLGRREFLLGMCGAPVILGSILLALPSILRGAGLLSGA